MAQLHLIEQLRAYLVAQGLVRVPSVAGSAPPAWLAPAGGTPAPGEGAIATERGTIVIGIYPAPGTVLGEFEQQWLTREGADIYIRTGPHNQPAALALARSIRRALADRRGFTMGALRVEGAMESRPAQLISSDEEQGATYLIAFEFLVRDAAFGA